MGGQAISLGLETLDLARVHEQALVTLTPPRSSSNGSNGAVKKAEIFFLEAIRPIEETHQGVQEATVQMRQLAGTLRERTAALDAALRQLHRETVRREDAVENLARGRLEQRQLVVQSRHLQEQLRHVAHRILLAQEEERREISRELHDKVAQNLTGINVQLAILKEASAINTRGLRQRIAQTQRLVQKSVLAVHRYARELRPALLDDLGLIPALRSFMKDLPGRRNLRMQLSVYAGVEVLSNAKRTVLYRVAQEALTNVTRHAHARQVSVTIRKIPDAVYMEVHDDGRSFAAQRVLASSSSKRLGLLGMRERLEMVGGSFTVVSAAGKGTTVCAQVPFDDVCNP